MAKLNAASKSAIRNLVANADSVARASFDNRMITFRRNSDEIVQIWACENYAWIRAEVEHPDDGTLYYVFTENEVDGINGAITSLLAKLTHDSLVNINDYYPKCLLSWLLGIEE